MPEWIKNVAGIQEDYWCDFIDPEGWYKAAVKWDGCIHYDSATNVPFGIPDRRTDSDCYWHICDIDHEIERLQALKEAALEHFGMWPR